MEVAKEVIMQMKQSGRNYAGYGLQKESEALVKHILQNMIKSSMPDMKPDVKNEEDSVAYREEGNQHFVAGEDTEAIEKYTMSLAYASSNELMAQAHANRSAALYRKRMYKECLMDIDAALDLGYPEEKRSKLKERAAKALGELKKMLGITERPLNEKQGTEESTKEKTSEPEPPPPPRPPIDPEAMNLKYGPNEEAPANSAGIRISYSEEFGRHMRATRPFKPGDLLTIEKPYSWVLYQDKFYTHCHHCLERSYNLIPCPHCPLAQYCSEKCRDTSWKLAHSVECPVLSVLFNLLDVEEEKIRTLMMMKIMRLVLTVTDKGTSIEELRQDMAIAEKNSDPRTAGFTDKSMLASDSPRSVLSLATNMNTRPLVGVCAFACISALTAILIASQSKFFGRKYALEELKDVDQIPNLAFCGSIMFRACVLVSSNCFSMQLDPGVKAGSGLFVVHSLYNHSCAPNTFRHFDGLTMLTRANQPINPGDQIFTGYGADYSYMPRSERRAKLLEQYFFECRCPACVNDWPTYPEILERHIGSISSNGEMLEKLKPYKRRLLADKYDVAAVKTVLQILHEEVEKPCEEILHAVQYLRSYYLDP